MSDTPRNPTEVEAAQRVGSIFGCLMVGIVFGVFAALAAWHSGMGGLGILLIYSAVGLVTTILTAAFSAYVVLV
ncbi:hypothetical protein SAMN04488092_10512 [Thalassovita taeanensis]|uniref:Uncharacterized protein n=1 Tax=Thalassovita taeanensis TaxID=657014 RepID=A0A1H9EDQ7_9RHOB|nr:hypothetical protein SAMN04488092_10512 [Thalassovita taeanensis]